MQWVHTPDWLRKALPQLVWDIPTGERIIYLTFDDGPTPGITPGVLALLAEYQVKATFFCLGSLVYKNPELFRTIREQGHTVGNHGYLHLSGFSTSCSVYIQNAIQGTILTGSYLFRPPYGRITPRQIRKLGKDHRIIMWSVMSMDFSRKITPQECLNNVIRHIKPGTIVVFHDTEKAAERMFWALSALLKWMNENGYRGEKITR